MLPSFTHKKIQTKSDCTLTWLKVQAYNCILLYSVIIIQIIGQHATVISGNWCIQIIQLLIKQYYYKKIEIQVGPALKG